MTMFISTGLSQSAQSLWRDKSFTLTVVLTMTSACGVFLWVLTLGWHLLLKPLPYPSADQLHLLQYQRMDGSGKLQSASLLHPAAEHLYQLQQQWQRQQPATADQLPPIELALIHQAQEVVMSDPAQPRVSAAYISPRFGPMLGMQLLLGQGFTESHQLQQRNPGVILSYQAWQLLFQQRPDVLQQSVLLNGVSHPVLGVTAADFVAPTFNQAMPTIDLWLPWDFNNADFKHNWHFPDDNTAVLLKGTTLAVDAWFMALSAPLQQEFASRLAAEPNFAGWTVRLDKLPLQQHLSQQHRGLLALLLIGASGLLLISSANILNLFLARLLLLQKQLAIRAALGARRVQLAQQLFSDALLLMLASAGLGLLLAHAGLAGFQQWTDGNPLPNIRPTLSTFSIVSALLLAVLLATVISAFSVHTVRYQQLSLALQTGSKGAGLQIPTVFRRGFVLLQLSCAIVLVFLSSLVVRDALVKLQRPLGFEPERVLQVEFAVSTLDWQGWSSYAPKVAEMATRLRQQAGIAGVSFAFNPLVDRFQLAATDLSNDRRFYPVHRNVDAHYFALLGQPLLAGEGFTGQDIGPQHNPKIVINQTFARQLLGVNTTDHSSSDNGLDLQSVIGRRIRLDIEQQPFQVIGVVADVQLPGLATTPPRFYMTNHGTALWLLIKLEPGAEFSKSQMIDTLRQAHSQFALTHFASLAELTNRHYLPQKLLLTGAITLAVFTLLISVVGLVGVVQYNLQLRHSEFCIKLALGARFLQIVRESLTETLRLFVGAVMLSLLLLTAIWRLSSALPELWPQLLQADTVTAAGGNLLWHQLPLYLLTLALATACAGAAHYWPLRRLKTGSISQGLSGATL